MQSEQFWAADERAEFEVDARFCDCWPRGSNAAQQNEHAHHDLPINRVLDAGVLQMLSGGGKVLSLLYIGSRVLRLQQRCLLSLAVAAYPARCVNPQR